jgi:NAD(P)-dependent dehydrogenase (short-subunit alcohol dehydrogenase family)
MAEVAWLLAPRADAARERHRHVVASLWLVEIASTPGAERVAVVFGGTSGIGLATARLLVEAGAWVTIAGRNRDKGERAAAALGPRARYVRADVTVADDVAAVIDDAKQRRGRLDWAVNAAALDEMRPARTADVTEQEWDRTIAVDLKGVWLAMKYELTAMTGAAGGGGSIVNVSSVNGLSATPNAVAYCASKHALHGLSKTAAMEYAAQGIRVNVVCPGAHLTPLLQQVFEHMSPGQPDRAEAAYREIIPMRRVGDPAECARAIVWLLSDAASYVTGAVLTVDGGLALRSA